jgi:allophanate hydrolase
MASREIATDIRGLRAAFSRGLDPAHVVESVFDAIDAAGDPGIFISLVDPKTARRAARGSAASIPQGRCGASVRRQGQHRRGGPADPAACPAFAYTPRASATAVARLLAAGALIIGKTNLDQFATGLVGVRTPYPVPRNPFDAAIVPGGSSSGSANAVARGLVPFALGTDTAGSGRIPAAFNNIVGKPSVGAVSTGRGAGLQHARFVSIFAGTVDDAWAVYEVIAGSAGRPFSRPIALGRQPVPPHAVIGILAPQTRNSSATRPPGRLGAPA